MRKYIHGFNLDSDADKAQYKAKNGTPIIEDVYTGEIQALDLHRPYIDRVKIQSPTTGQVLTRIPEVLDVWMDSGSMPYAQMHYPFANKQAMEASFPADFIAEYVGQVRAWFYVMHVLGVILFDAPAFKNVAVTGVIYGTDGRKMSKSLGNYPDPRETIQRHGGDALRHYLLSSTLLTGADIAFSEEGIIESVKKTILPLWNAYTFFTTYANIDNFEPKENRIWFVRHGEATANALKRINCGDNPSTLTKKGVSQAEETGRELARRGLKFDLIISSPLARARQTAEIIALELGGNMPIIEDESMREQRVGGFENRLHAEVREEFIQKNGHDHDWTNIYRNNPTEPWSVFLKRVATGYEHILAEHPDKKILIVAHGGVHRALVGYGYDLSADETTHLAQFENGGVITLPETPITNILDKWILSELQKFILTVREGFETYDLPRAARAITTFMDTLTNFYIRRSRRRFWRSEHDADKTSAYETLHHVLMQTALAVAPIIPFVSEEIYRGLTGRESVHLEYTPLVSRALIFPDLDRAVQETRTIITLGLALRARRRLRVRQPLSSITIGHRLDPYYEDIIREELNVKEIIVSDMGTLVRSVCRPNARKLGPRLGARVQEVIREAKSGNFTLLADGRVQVGDIILEPAEFELVYEPTDPTADVEGGDGIVIAMDTQVTPKLEIEGYARDIVRMIQEARRTAGYSVSDRIEVTYSGARASDILAVHQAYIEAETLSATVSAIQIFDTMDRIELDDGSQVEVSIRRPA